MTSYRKPLIERGMTGEWTPFESHLFNLFTQYGIPLGDRFIFSQRLRITQAMLDACDAEMAIIKAESEAHG